MSGLRLARGRRTLRIRLVLPLVLTGFVAYASAAVTAITVLPFTPVEGEQRTWLGTGIADILSRNLAEFDQYRVVERGRLQVYLREMELQGSALTDTDLACRPAFLAFAMVFLPVFRMV